MRSLILSATMAVLLTAAIVPGALATDPSGTDAPTQIAEATPAPTATGPYDGTIVVDPTFVSGGELPTQPPANGAGRPRPGITPPPTDAVAVAGAPIGPGLPIPIVLVLAAGAIATLFTPGRARRAACRR